MFMFVEGGLHCMYLCVDGGTVYLCVPKGAYIVCLCEEGATGYVCVKKMYCMCVAGGTAVYISM